jgi:pimeloyl-ACP methyl ester carboxylesterase
MRAFAAFLIAAACGASLSAAENEAPRPAAAPTLQAVVFGDNPNERVEFLDYAGPAVAAPTIVLLHGGQCTADDWSAVAPILARKYRVVVPDGFVHPFDPWRLWLLLDHLKISRAALLGHSAGGPVIRAMYRLAPDRVWAMVDIDGAAFGPLILARNLPNDRYSPTAAALYEKHKALMLQLRPGHQGDYPSAVTIERRLMAYERSKISPEARAAARPIENVVHLPAAPPAPAAIADQGKFILSPCLEIQTGRGKLRRADFTSDWVEKNFQARNIRYELIEEAGHWPWLEDLEGFLAILDPFLAEHAAAAR